MLQEGGGGHYLSSCLGQPRKNRDRENRIRRTVVRAEEEMRGYADRNYHRLSRNTEVAFGTAHHPLFCRSIARAKTTLSENLGQKGRRSIELLCLGLSGCRSSLCSPLRPHTKRRDCPVRLQPVRAFRRRTGQP